MRRLARLVAGLAAGLLLAGPAGAQEKPRPETHEHSFADVEHWVQVFEDESRREWQKPIDVLAQLGVMEGEIVADIGAGTGYFTGLLTIEVGAAGKVYAVELEQAMLDHIATRVDVQPDRIVYVLAEPGDPKLPAGEVDLVLMVNTWHHIEKRSKYLHKLATALSPEGRIAIIDYHEGELPVGPPPGHKLSREAVIAEFEKGGFKLVSESVMLPYQYFLTFYRK